MEKLNVYAAVIGGGASGLMCAARASGRLPEEKIVVLEKADRVGKKILVTGNGRCNLTNINASSADYHGEGSEELINILYENYGPVAVLEAFRDMLLLTRTDGEGRVYPLSNTASSVLDVLRAHPGITEMCGANIRSVRKTDKGFQIMLPDKIINCRRLVIAAGGRSDYAGRAIDSAGPLRGFGLSYTAPGPSLSPVKVKGELIRPLKGIRAEARASLIRGGRVVKAERGEVQFTDNALSGICVFNLSREANKGGCEIAVDLLPDMSKGEVRAELERRIAARGASAPASGIFTGAFHKNIGLALLKQSGIEPSVPCGNISDKELKRLYENGAVLRFECRENSDFSKAQVTAGGVKLSEIDPYTFESKKHPGLYIIGEALDIDGDCGGYNLQFAWASGMCAGDSL